MRTFITVLIVFCTLQFGYTQENKAFGIKQILGTDQNSTKSHVLVYQEDNLNNIIKNHIDANAKLKGIPGWRVQIYFGSGQGAKEKAQEIEKDFNTLFPEHKSYLIYQAPYFKIYVGNFRTKREAYKFKSQIINKYPGCWTVKDFIDANELEQ